MILATFPRGPDVELRVSLATFDGRPYVALRVFERGQGGQLWPVKGKGCSVRLGECQGMIEALRRALELADSGPSTNNVISGRPAPSRRPGTDGGTAERGQGGGIPTANVLPPRARPREDRPDWRAMELPPPSRPGQGPPDVDAF
jgi:hypothetical protein